MTDAEVIERTNEVFVDEFEVLPDKINPEAHIFADLGLDSLDVVDLIVALQMRFQVKVRNDVRVRSVRTMQDLYDYLIQVREETAQDENS